MTATGLIRQQKRLKTFKITDKLRKNIGDAPDKKDVPLVFSVNKRSSLKTAPFIIFIRGIKYEVEIKP